MSMFPGAGAQVYRNEAGEPIGWDYPSDDDPNDRFDDEYDSRHADAADCYIEELLERHETASEGEELDKIHRLMKEYDVDDPCEE